MQLLETKKITQTVRTKNSCNLLRQKKYAASWEKIEKPLRTQKNIMQHLGTEKSHNFLRQKKIRQWDN